MSAPRSGRLSLPDASIHYEVRGSGPAVLLVATGNGDATPLAPMAEELARDRTVITYDRRGFSRSTCFAPVVDAERVDVDASDARHLVDHLAGGRADVFGSCSGAVVALALLQRHPGRVGRLVAHEPPLASILPDAERWIAYYDDLYRIYREDGVTEAKRAFREHVGLGEVTRPPVDAQLPADQLEQLMRRLGRNLEYWFEHEVRSFPRYLLDLGALSAHAARLVLAGSTTGTEQFAYRPIRALADVLGLPLWHFPGGHVGHVTHPVEFARTLAAAFSGSLDEQLSTH